MKIAVIGLGWWGPKLVRNLLALPDIRAVIGCDPDENRRRSIEDDFGIETTARLESVLEDRTVTALAIASPPTTHYEIARMALSAGKHVITEKPPAVSGADLDDLIALADRHHLVYMLDSTYVFSDAIKGLKALLDDGAFAIPTSAQSLRYGDNVRRDGIGRLENTMLKNGIDAIADLVYHDLAILQHLLRGPTVVTAVHSVCNLWDDLCDTAYIDLRIGECPAHIGLSWTLPERRRDLTLFSRGHIVVCDDLRADAKLTTYSIATGTETIVASPMPAGEPLAAAVAHFAHCIRTGEPPLTGSGFMRRLMGSFEDVRRVQKLSAVAESAGAARYL